MIILTGAKGFIGKCFADKLTDEVILVDQEDAWRLFTDFDDWNKVNLSYIKVQYHLQQRKICRSCGTIM